mgnify:CR=1 FL=1
MIRIVYEDNHLLVVEKPVNVPCQKDESGDDDLLTILKEYIKKRDGKPGNVYLGLVHRLDRPVGGLMVFAKTSKAAERLSRLISKRNFHKEYLAVCTGVFPSEGGTLTDYLLKDHKTNTVKVTDSDRGKIAVLDYGLLETKDNLNLVRIDLHTGRSHQIRVQMAHNKTPLWGDQRYNTEAVKHQQIALWAWRLEFTHPTTKETLCFTLRPPETYPWNCFNTVSGA